MKEVSAQEAFGKFKPESCVFVISLDRAGKPNGMVAGWNMKCSSNPPLFAVCLSKKGNTHHLIRASREFVVAVPNKRLESEVRFFGTRSGREVDKFKETGIKTLRAKKIRSPLVKEATINLECKLEKEVDVGNHIMFVGRIVASHIDQKKGIILNMGKNKAGHIFQEF